MSLVNTTFNWLKQEWADKVDFVVCKHKSLLVIRRPSFTLSDPCIVIIPQYTGTGDNARHDIDSEIPRTPTEINELNRMMVRRMKETFGDDVVIVPSLGNNDIYREFTRIHPCFQYDAATDHVSNMTAHNILVAGPNAVTNSFTE